MIPVLHMLSLLCILQTCCMYHEGRLEVVCILLAESYGDVRGQLERGGEPIDEDFFERWLKAKGGVDEAEACIRAHAHWRADNVPLGRILEVQHHLCHKL